MNSKDHLTVWLIAFFLATGLVPLSGGVAFAEMQAAFIGSKACSECHDTMMATFSGSLHAKAWAADTRFAAAGCESCHGPGSEHQKDQTPGSIVSFSRGTTRDAEQLSSQCLACHAASPAVALWDFGKHRKNGVACQQCHAIHEGASPLARQPDVCFGCHRDIKSQVDKLSHHPIREGKVVCSNCHNTHGTLTAHMIKADSVNELCYTCHAEKRGPFIWEHPPVEEHCTTCHTPHGSRHGKLLVQKVPNLCQECHDWSRHPGTAYDANAGFGGRAPSNRFFGRSCLNCHGQIHGSWAPANPNNGENAGDVWMR
ncbi:MAG: DmsE family decaheme c-type cytochrome [Candidatus Methylomirabilia bacterium]